MAPKAPEKSPQPPTTHNNANVNAAVIKHSNSPFYISAHTLCHNRRLKQKRSRYVECIRNALSRPAAAAAVVVIACNKNKTEARRRKLSLLRPEVTIDLLSDEEDQMTTGPATATELQQKQSVIVYPQRMCLERAAILGLMPVERLKNGPPPLVPLAGVGGVNKQKRTTTNQQNNSQKIHIQPHLQHQQHYHQQQQQQLQQPRKRKSRPQKRCSLPSVPPVLLNNESIVLSDDSDAEQTPSPIVVHPTPISMPPELAVIYPNCHQPQSPPATLQNTMQVDEEVTISLVPRSLTATTCARSRSSLNTSINNDSTTNCTNNNNNVAANQDPPFPMLPDETTVHTVIANRIYELSLTKLREGLASCGIPEFNGGQQKISPPRRKGAVIAPPIVTQPQAPISLKLSSDLSISLISDDEDDLRHHRKNETLLSPAFLQKLPVNVSIAPVVSISPHSAASVAVDPRKLKFG